MKTVKIKSIKLLSERTDTYDISVNTDKESERNFFANGIAVHNSNGIEPSFSQTYMRNVIVEGKSTKKKMTVESYEFLAYKQWSGKHDMDPKDLPEYFIDAQTLTPKKHVDVQAAAQYWLDSATSKCVVKGTRILTNYGIKRVEDLGLANKPGEFGAPLKNLMVYCPDGIMREVINHYYDGRKDTIRVRFNNGYILEGSAVHKVMTGEGWKSLGELTLNDVVLRKRAVVHNNAGGQILPEAVFNVQSKYIVIPTYMSTELSLLLGMLAADGSNARNSYCVAFHNKNKALIDMVYDLFLTLFNRQPKLRLDKRTDVYSVYINSKTLSDWLVVLMGNKAGGKFVPEEIMSGSVAEQRNFLSGVSLDGYNTGSNQSGVSRTVIYEGKSKDLADGIFSLCASIGYSPVLSEKYVKSHDYFIHGVKVYDYNDSLQTHKNSEGSRESYHVVVPAGLRELQLQTNHPQYSAIRSLRQRPEQKLCSSNMLDSLGIPYDATFDAVKVTDITTSQGELYDIEVKDSHDYLIDGLWSHNTVNCPTDISFDDFKDVYLYAIDKGLKGLATFRYNPEAFTGVLVREEDLKATNYEFHLEDGSTLTLNGADEVEYKGEMHNVSNLADAIKIGTYGKY